MLGERLRKSVLAFGSAKGIYMTLEAGYDQGRRNMEGVFMRFKDLLAYSQEHAEIMDRREGREMLGLVMFLGMSSNPQLRDYRQRLRLLSEEDLAYEGRKKINVADIAGRKDGKTARPDNDNNSPIQRRL